MALYTYSGKETTPKNLPRGTWVPVTECDHSEAPHTIATAYVYIVGYLEDGHETGIVEQHAVRVGTTDDTAVEDIIVKRRRADGYFYARHNATWIGSSHPGGFRWELKAMQGVRSAEVRTRYSKAGPY